MAVQTRSTLKGWFLAGLKPLASQFADWIDSFWHKSDTINISDIEGLQTELDALAGGGGGGAAAGGEIVSMASGNTTLVLNSNQMLRFMYCRSASTQVIKCGTSSGGTQIFNVEVGSSGGYIHEETFATGASGSLTLHFTASGAWTLLIQKITFS
jgi:hypothetical protein